MDENKKNEKRSLLAGLINMAKVDHSIKDVEFQFLLAIASQLGVTKNELKELFEEHIEFNPPKIEYDRIVQFQRLVLLMNVDLEIDASEINYLKNLGMRMGLNSLAIDEVLAVMNNYPNKIIPPEKLIGIFTTFHN